MSAIPDHVSTPRYHMITPYTQNIGIFHCMPFIFYDVILDKAHHMIPLFIIEHYIYMQKFKFCIFLIFMS